MSTMIGILCFTLMYFYYSMELAWSYKPDTVHPLPIRVHVHFYESIVAPGEATRLPAYLFGVATRNEVGHKYGIGAVLQGFLFPFLAPKEDNPNIYERVKIRIDGNTATVTVPISNEDPLNNLFQKQFWSEHVLPAEVAE